MRASAAVTLFLLSSASIFGIATSQTSRHGSPSVAPVWVNGVMGVWDPDSGQFVPATSPLFDDACERIQRRRDLANGYYYSDRYYIGHHWSFSPGSSSYSYSSGAFSSSHSTFSGSHASSGSARGGIGAASGGHGGGE